MAWYDYLLYGGEPEDYFEDEYADPYGDLDREYREYGYYGSSDPLEELIEEKKREILSHPLSYYYEAEPAEEMLPWWKRYPMYAAGGIQRMISSFGKMPGQTLGWLGDIIDVTPDIDVKEPLEIYPTEGPPKPVEEYEKRRTYAGTPWEQLQGYIAKVPEEEPEAFGYKYKGEPSFGDLLKAIGTAGETLFDISDPSTIASKADRQRAAAEVWHEQNKSSRWLQNLDRWATTTVDVGSRLGMLALMGTGFGKVSKLITKGKEAARALPTNIFTSGGNLGRHAQTFARGYSITEGDPVERLKGGAYMAAYTATPSIVAKFPIHSTLGRFFADMGLNMGISHKQYKEVWEQSPDWATFVDNFVNVAIGDAIPSLFTPGAVRKMQFAGKYGLKGGVRPFKTWREAGEKIMAATKEERGAWSMEPLKSRENINRMAGLGDKDMVELIRSPETRESLEKLYGAVEKGKLSAEEGATKLKAMVEPTKPTPKVEAPKVEKPWEMTREEFETERTRLQTEMKTLEAKKDLGPKYESVVGQEMRLFVRDLWPEKELKTHKSVIQEAIKQHEPVPPEVLKDYPDLAEQAKLVPKVKEPWDTLIVSSKYEKGMDIYDWQVETHRLIDRAKEIQDLETRSKTLEAIEREANKYKDKNWITGRTQQRFAQARVEIEHALAEKKVVSPIGEIRKERISGPVFVRDRITQLKAGISEGEMRLRSKVNAIGERLSKSMLESIERTVERNKEELARLQAPIPPKPPAEVAEHGEMEQAMERLYERLPELKRITAGKPVQIGKTSISKILKGDWGAVDEAIKKASKILYRKEAQIKRIEARLKGSKAEMRKRLLTQKYLAVEKVKDAHRIYKEIQSAKKKLNQRIAKNLTILQKISSPIKGPPMTPQLRDLSYKLFGGYNWKDISKAKFREWKEGRAALEKAIDDGTLNNVGMPWERVKDLLKKPANLLTVEELDAYAAIANQIRQLNIDAKKDIRGEYKTGFERKKDELLGIPVFPGWKREPPPIEPHKAKVPEGFWGRIEKFAKKWDVAMYRGDRLFETFGRKWHDAIFKPVDRSHDEYMKRSLATEERTTKMIDDHLGGWKGFSRLEKETVKIGPHELSGTEALKAYMYSRNPNALQKLMDNNGFSESDINALRQYAEKNEGIKNFAEEMFAIHRENFPALRELIFKLTGKEMGYQRNYSPLLTIRELFHRTQPDYIFEMLSSFGIPVGFEKTFAKGRTPHARPLDLDLTRDLFHNMNVVNKFISMGESLTHANRLYRDKDIQRYLREKFGDEPVRRGGEWINQLIKPRQVQNDFGPVIRYFRTHAAASVLGLNVITGLKQGLSTMAAMSFVKPQYMLRGWSEVIKNRNANREFVGERDEKIKQRFRRGTMERDIRELKGYAPTHPSVPFFRGSFKANMTKLSDKSLFMIKGIDRLTVEAVWRGAYEQALAKGMSEKEAIDFARMVFRRTQPMGGDVDLPFIFNGGELERMLTMFQNQVNQNWLLLRHDAFRDFLGGNRFGGASKVLFAYILPALIFGSITRGRVKRSKKELAEDLITYPVAGIVLAGNIIRSLFSGFEAQPLPLKAMAKPLEIVNWVAKGDYGKAFEKTAETGAMYLGFPFQAPRRTIKGIRRLKKGEAEFGWRELVWSPWAMRGRKRGKKPKAKEKKKETSWDALLKEMGITPELE